MAAKPTLEASEMRILKQAALAAFLAVFFPGLALAGTYDATAYSATYGTGWSKQAIDGGYATMPATLSATLAASQNITIEAHFKVSSVPSSTQVMVGSGDWGWIGILSSGFLQVNNNGGGNITTSASVADGEWHVVTVVQNSSAIAAYLDGNQIGLITSSITTVPATTTFGINAFPGGTFQFSGTVDEVSFWTTTRDLQNFNPLSTPLQGIEPGLVALYHLDGDVTDSTETPVAADLTSDGPVFFSPYTWAFPTDGSRASIDAGAYFKTSFTGNQCSLSFDMVGVGTPLSQVYVSVDGLPPAQYQIDQIVPCAPSSLVVADHHSLRVSIKATSQNVTRWSTLPGTRVALRTINIGPSQSFSAPKTYPRWILYYGDSITEGVRTLGHTQAYDVDQNDNMVEWSAQSAQRLDAEYGIVGFGSTGLTTAGSGGVPALPSAWNLLYPGQSRDFSHCPDVMIENEGTNDGSAAASDVQSAETTFLNAFSTTCPSTKVAVMRPFNGSQWSALQASVASFGNRNFSLLDTTGFLNVENGMDDYNLHPIANNAVNYLAPQVAASLSKIINAYPVQSYTFR